MTNNLSIAVHAFASHDIFGRRDAPSDVDELVY